MELTLALALPRDRLSVPVARRILKQSLETLGIDGEAIGDVELAMTEACTNVLDHASGDEAYEVRIGLKGHACVIEVVDTGRPFDGTDVGHTNVRADAENGRGIQLMRALMDRLEFENTPTSGTIVHLEKHLTWAHDSPIAQLERNEHEVPLLPR